MFAVIESGGKQYKVKQGDKILLERLGAQPGETVVFDKVLLKEEDGKVEIGTPYIKGAKVEVTVIEEKRGKKQIVFRYHSKTRYRKKKMHRQTRTAVSVVKI